MQAGVWKAGKFQEGSWQAQPLRHVCKRQRGVWQGTMRSQRAPGHCGQGLQNPAGSGAGVPWKRVPRGSPRFCRREWASQGSAAFMSRKRARLHSLWEGTELRDSSPSPAAPAAPAGTVLGSMEPGSMGGVPAQSWPQRRSQAGNHNPARRNRGGSNSASKESGQASQRR